MKIIYTLNDIIELGMLGLLIAFSIIMILIAVIDVYTKDWRYKHFKCPNCKNKQENGSCGHWRNSKCDCKFYSRKEKVKKLKKIRKSKHKNNQSVIDYTTNFWGHAFYTDKDKNTAEGFYSKLITEKNNIEDGALIIRCFPEKHKVFLCRISEVDWCNDPNDMYFCKYTQIKSLDELSDYEKQRVDSICKTYGINDLLEGE